MTEQEYQGILKTDFYLRHQIDLDTGELKPGIENVALVGMKALVDIARQLTIANENAVAARGKVTESIFSGESTVIPLADVSHVEKRAGGNFQVITRHARWDFDNDSWANSIYLPREEGEKFMAAWCQYRHEIEGNTLADLTPVEEPA